MFFLKVAVQGLNIQIIHSYMVMFLWLNNYFINKPISHKSMAEIIHGWSVHVFSTSEQEIDAL